MAHTMSRVDRVYRVYDVTVTDADGAAVAVTGVDVALLIPRRTPDDETVWTTADYADGAVTLLLAGPAADSTDALVVPAGGADLWLRVTDDPEVTAARVERISIS